MLYTRLRLLKTSLEADNKMSEHNVSEANSLPDKATSLFITQNTPTEACIAPPPRSVFPRLFSVWPRLTLKPDSWVLP